VTALGYATVWIDGALRREGRSEAIGEAIGIPDDRVVRIILPIGVPAEEGPRKEKKPFAKLDGRPIFIRSLEAFINREDVAQTILVAYFQEMQGQAQGQDLPLGRRGHST